MRFDPMKLKIMLLSISFIIASGLIASIGYYTYVAIDGAVESAGEKTQQLNQLGD